MCANAANIIIMQIKCSYKGIKVMYGYGERKGYNNTERCMLLCAMCNEH